MTHCYGVPSSPQPRTPSTRYLSTNPLRREQGIRLLTYNLPEPLRVVLIRALRRPPLFEGKYTEPAIQSLYRSHLSDADLASTSQSTKRVLVLAEVEVTRRTVEAPMERISRMTRNTLLVAKRGTAPPLLRAHRADRRVCRAGRLPAGTGGHRLNSLV
jgi:hypothetical protein